MFIVSFCHAYNDEIETQRSTAPALVVIDENKFQTKSIINLTFPRNPDDFASDKIQTSIYGDNTEIETIQAFKHLPRFGVTGLCSSGAQLYCATWNGIYHLNKALKPIRFISNRMMSDLHGIDVHGDYIYSLSPALDLVLVSNKHTGKIVDYVQVGNQLNIYRDEKIKNYDWRFISKQRRGAVGLWHFNNITVNGDKIYLTSRLFSCLVELDLNMSSACLRSFNWDTPVMIHDGIPLQNGGFGFTSVDGKIIEANLPNKLDSSMSGMEQKGFSPLMRRDMNTLTTRLHNVLGREVNWCRGLHEDVTTNSWITTIDGRYDQERPYFQVMRLNRSDERYQLLKIGYDSCEFPRELRYMTGFDICKITK